MQPAIAIPSQGSQGTNKLIYENQLCPICHACGKRANTFAKNRKLLVTGQESQARVDLRTSLLQNPYSNNIFIRQNKISQNRYHKSDFSNHPPSGPKQLYLLFVSFLQLSQQALLFHNVSHSCRKDRLHS